MSLEISGKLIRIYPTVQVSEKLKKREFVLELTESVNGNNYTQFAKFQTTQAKCEVLDKYNQGDQVKVSFNIKGARYEKDGKENFFTNLDCWRIEKVGQQNNQQYQQQQAPPQARQNEGIPVYSASHTTNGGSGYAQPAPQAGDAADDGLPF